MAISIDAIVSSKITTSANVLSHSHTVAAGSDRMLVAIIAWQDHSYSVTPYVASATYNSVAMTQRAQLQYEYDAGTPRALIIEIWTLAAPATGANTFQVTLSENTFSGFAATTVSLTGVDSVGNTGSGSDYGTAATANVTTADTSSLVIGGIVTRGTSGPYTAGSGMTERVDDDTGGGVAGSDVAWFVGSRAGTGGSDAFAADLSTDDNWALAAIELVAASSGYTLTASAGSYV
ncbi:MAG: hypothetical protein KC547_08250, partial [Anaerolineae bacterium]|nr:hypothetical protein [Anaerolineae bacterium]